jgi:hypothetical protein
VLGEVVGEDSRLSEASVRLALQMLRELSPSDARRAFDRYAAREPRLVDLWRRCEQAGPCEQTRAADDDLDDPDERLGDEWCAERFFLEDIKPDLVDLVGMHRPNGPPDLQASEAYDVVYATLFLHALNRTCACCGPRVPAASALSSVV